MIPPTDSNAYRARNKTSEKYRFTKIFKDTTDQQTFFNETTLNSVQDLLSGNNALIFAYGVTNSGKTYSVIGKNDDPGLIPRSINLIFNSIKKHLSETKLKPSMHSLITCYENEAEENRDLLTLCPDQEHVQGNQKIEIDQSFEYGIWISFIEIYNEQIFDLLDPSKPSGAKKRNQLHLKYEQRTGNKYVADMHVVKVKSAKEASALLAFGQQNRQVFSTAMNQESSRSHSVFTVHVLRCPVDQDNFVIEDAQYASLSKLSFVDLAGSERYRNTLSSGQRLKEAGNINKSLMVLGQCMEMLRLNQMRSELNKNPAVIPYRHSKLTEIFKTSFEGDGKATIIVNVNPFDTGFDENNHVMKFSAVAKDITTLRKIKPVVDLKNIKAGSKRLREMSSTQEEEYDEEEEGTIIDEVNEDILFIEDLISRLELIKERQDDVETIEARISQHIIQEMSKKLLNFAIKEKELMQHELDKQNQGVNMEDKALLNSLLAKQTLIIEEMNTLKSEAHKGLLNKIEEGKKLKNDDASNEINSQADERPLEQQSNDADIEYSKIDQEDDGSISEQDIHFETFLRLRKQLRRSIFKKDVLGEDTNVIMKQIEEFEGVTFNLAKETKMGKLLKVIASENFEKDPFQIQNRAFRLFRKYAQLSTPNDDSRGLTPQYPIQATLSESGLDFQELQEENFKLKRQMKTIHESHVRLKQAVEMVMNQPRLQVADNDVTIGPLKEVGVRTHVSMAIKQ
ncbi:hypothetical protein G6F46_008757 [Rhizopus delemar]|uniref:Kinesin-like protein n=1 Tax=Rhizopus delemar TaxID=936053 RepID=A0A9P7CLS9_9FUNG|nr:hypothetical protein G6F53_008542 [Rhizopus delemar]KAG1566962.1 hypothetical protein G6F50_008647 [Rhizopus delemar]KAG1581477.1 hypothetical protein G6F48_009775 [Rhizopus delemar]KAG1612088.1 hypothetical protein G6F46_008757 [Rhizopus delemar]